MPGAGQVNARQDCCGCASPKFQCCKPDANGVNRCYGTPAGATACKTGYTGVAPCCIAAGQQCTFSSECCAGAPCVPDAMGTLRCLTAPPSGPACVTSGGVCTASADCCAGLSCNIAVGSLKGTCGVTTPPPPPGNDGGQPPPTCATAGQMCKTTADCCYGNCTAPGGTGAACAAGQAGCTCVYIIP
jgi:hypothetical protein